MAIRVLIVEDSLTIRKYIAGVVAGDPEFDLVGEAEDGKQAIELCSALKPDVVSMDMMLPVLSGLAATEYIMAYCPTPILIVSASLNRGEVFKTYDALSAGALDVMDKPSDGRFGDAWEQRYLMTLRLISRIKVITHPRARLVPPPAPAATGSLTAALTRRDRAYQCVAMGASTGGPGAVLEVLRGLPADFPLPILLVIHISAPFAPSMCEWLDGLSPLRVACAREGEELFTPGEPARVLMANADRHLVARDGKVWFSSEPERHSCRPSADVLFESVASEFGPAAIGCLLTGMGRDGAQGMLAIRRAGGLTLAQDQTTSVVFGMPREAILLGAAGKVLPLDEIASHLTAAAQSRRGARTS